jgi:predicted regulator of Ras-like GTPase activity (Roadblock/LC7/MglB family)
MTTGLGTALQELRQTNGLEMAAIVSADGLVVEAAASGDLDVESICSVASNGLLMMDALGQELGAGQALMTTLEYEGRTVVMTPAGNDHLLVLLADAGTNLGRIRIVARRHLPQLADQLSAV